MRSRVLLSVLIIGLAVPVFANNICVVDMQQIVSESQIGKKAQGTLTALQKTKEAEIKVLREELGSVQKLFNDRASQDTTGDYDAYVSLVASNRLLEAAKARVMQAQEDANALVQNTQLELVQGMEKEIVAVVTQIAGEEGYTIVLDKNSSVVKYASTTADITALVLAQLAE